MRSLLLIAQREFAENVRTKGFWIGLFLLPAILLLAGTVPFLISQKGTSNRAFVILDGTTELEPILQQQLRSPWIRTLPEVQEEPDSSAGDVSVHLPESAEILEGGSIVRFEQMPLPDSIQSLEFAQAEAMLRDQIRGRTPAGPREDRTSLFAAIVIPPDFLETSQGEWRYWSQNPAETDLQYRVESVLTRELQRREYIRLGLDPDVIARVQMKRPSSTVLDVRKPVGQEQVGLSDQLRMWMPSFFVYLLWVAVLSIAQMLLNGVIEEKSNRVIEVLLSSVTPSQLMLGKLVGIAAVGFIMLATWLGTLVGVAFWQVARAPIPSVSQPVAVEQADGVQQFLPATADAELEAPSSAPQRTEDPPMDFAVELSSSVLEVLRSTWIIPACIFYFLTGYFLYAALFLTIGSLCNTIKDAQTLFAPLVLILMVPLFLIPFIPKDPHGILATTLSWTPIYTPFVMMNRVAADPPLRDLIGTTVLLLGFNVLVFWGCGKIFRMGILRTGQPPRFMEWIRWLRRDA